MTLAVATLLAISVMKALSTTRISVVTNGWKENELNPSLNQSFSFDSCPKGRSG